MGLLEKLKNTFFEEEYIEVEEDTRKEEKPIARKVEIKPKKEEKVEIEEKVVEEVKSEEPEVYTEKELMKKDNAIHYFEDEDFVDVLEEIEPKQETVKIYGENPDKLYNNTYYQAEEAHKPYSNSNKTGFKPTPVISPIYGILDKNYRKEEVVDRKDKPSSYVSRRNADLDFVRNKAFGKLEDDIMLDSFTTYQEPVSEDFDDIDEDVEENTLLADMTNSLEPPAVEKVTIADAEEYFEDLGLEYNIDYKDSRYEKATGRRSKKVKEKELVEEENVVESEINREPEIESEVESSQIEENTNDDDNLFDLVDLMYEEKE